MTLGKHLIALLFIALVVIPCSTLVFAQTSSEVTKGGPPTACVDQARTAHSVMRRLSVASFSRA